MPLRKRLTVWHPVLPGALTERLPALMSRDGERHAHNVLPDCAGHQDAQILWKSIAFCHGDHQSGRSI
jgi:hypothetical protein